MMEKSVISWKIEATALLFIVFCISLSFYTAFVSFQTLDETLRKQLVTFAASFLITGLTIFAALMVHVVIKKAFSRTEAILKSGNRAKAKIQPQQTTESRKR